MSFAFSRSNSPEKSQQSQMPKPPTKLTFNTDRILWKWVRHVTRLRRARDAGRMQTRASTDREEQQVQWQTPQRHGVPGGRRKTGRAFWKTHTRTRLEAGVIWLRTSCVEEGWATEETRVPVCAVTAGMWCWRLRRVQREVGLERWARLAHFAEAPWTVFGGSLCAAGDKVKHKRWAWI